MHVNDLEEDIKLKSLVFYFGLIGNQVMRKRTQVTWRRCNNNILQCF